MKKKILITGGCGFIGTPVVNKIASCGYEVHVLSRTHQKDHDNIKYHCIDLFNLSDIKSFMLQEKFSSLIHLAWFVGKKCHVSDLNIDCTIATLNLVQSFIENGGNHFLGAGSVSEYDYSFGLLNEFSTPTNNSSLYGKCKNSLYSIVQDLCKQHKIKFQWPRIFNCYGPFEKTTRLMPSCILSALNGEDINVSHCEKYQDYLHVYDTAQGIVDLFNSDIEGAVNICSGRPVFLKDIVLQIVKLTNFKGNINWGAIPESFNNKIVIGDNNILVNKVGWKQHYDLEEGLVHTIEWWKKNNKL